MLLTPAINCNSLVRSEKLLSKLCSSASLYQAISNDMFLRLSQSDFAWWIRIITCLDQIEFVSSNTIIPLFIRTQPSQLHDSKNGRAHRGADAPHSITIGGEHIPACRRHRTVGTKTIKGAVTDYKFTANIQRMYKENRVSPATQKISTPEAPASYSKVNQVRLQCRAL